MKSFPKAIVSIIREAMVLDAIIIRCSSPGASREAMNESPSDISQKRDCSVECSPLAQSERKENVRFLEPSWIGCDLQFHRRN